MLRYSKLTVAVPRGSPHVEATKIDLATVTIATLLWVNHGSRIEPDHAILTVFELQLIDASPIWPCSSIQDPSDIDLGGRLSLSGVQLLQNMTAGDPFVISSLQ
jgi:hypothetical protein